MTFKKLSDNKLKIILSADDLPNNGDFDEFMSDSSRAKDTFINILEKAYDEVGFNAQDCKVKIDAAVLHNGTFAITVTKLLKLKNVSKPVRPVKVAKKVEEDTHCAVYTFKNFEDICVFAKFLRQSKIVYLRALASSIELYFYNNCYYLTLSGINNVYKHISRFYSSITEFSRYCSGDPLYIIQLKEKGKLILGNNALNSCQKYFK